MICESHHLNNLDDYNIYDTGKCYESTEQGKVNLQYVAVILRTVDLLHITMDRTPAIEYRVFCPRDPKSVIEWQKQMAIRAIKEYIKKYISITDEIQVVEENIDGVICAYARRYRKYFQEYSLVEYMGQKNFLNEEKVPLPIGICFEGIRIRELAALKEYLKRNQNNYFQCEIEIRIKCNEKTSIDVRQFEVLKNYIQKKNING